ncbi:unnamed protein product [Owenia fusiformis]|uniref:CCHC-type domain-containing protein n=1 Tax=Owenia fusiformis TaxID=6347 RepID=A0A8S4NHQ1_OWEFU|nr:unnamed protein product [Owenia fusiformis]
MDLRNRRLPEISKGVLKEDQDIMADMSLRPGKFNGHSEEDPALWFSNFESWVSICDKTFNTPEKIVHSLRLLLGPSAQCQSWFGTMSEDDKKDISSIKTSFLKHFGDGQVLWSLENKLADLKMADCSSLEDYVTQIHSLGNRLGRSEQDKTRQFVRNLTDPIKYIVYPQNVTTWQAAVNAARIAEETLKIAGDLSKPKTKMASIVCQLCSGEGHSASECIRTSANAMGEKSGNDTSSTKCQICSKSGHGAADCWYRYKDSRENRRQENTRSRGNNNYFPRSQNSSIVCYACNQPGHKSFQCNAKNLNG